MATDIEKLLAQLSPEKRKLLELQLKKKGSAGNAFPLSYAQQRLWFLYLLEPESIAYNIPAAVRLKGKLNIPVLEKALNEIVRRHEVLRTTFTTINGTPMQVVAPEGNLPLHHIDLSGIPEEEREKKLRSVLEENSRIVFNLTKGPLINVHLIKLAENEHILQICMHHIISDGWSVSVFVNEFSTLYTSFLGNRPSPLPELRIQYADFARWQKKRLEGSVREELLGYWKKVLGGHLPVLELPTDHPRPAVKSYRGGKRLRTVSGELLQKVRKISQEQSTTPFMTLLTAFYALLYRYSGQDDICVGTPIANRNRAETEGLIGFFVNTLVLRGDLSGEPSFLELLQRTKETALEAFTYQDLPFEMLVEELNPERSLSHTPLFQVMFVHQSAAEGNLKLPGLEVEGIPLEGDTAKFDLTLTASELPDALALNFEYDSDIFNADTVDRMLEHYQTLLEAALDAPQQPISRLEILGQEERRLLLEEWQPRETHYTPDFCVHQIFEQQVEKFADRPALSFDGKNISYKELNERANKLAHYLLKKGVTPDTPVGIYLERSPEVIIAILGILKAGAAYMPMDPLYPVERVSFMIEDADTRLIVTQDSLKNNLPAEKCTLICLDTDRTEIELENSHNPDVPVKPHHLIYIIYTSGSTGKPKGTLLSHYNVRRLFQATDHWFGFNENDVWSLFFSYAFDFSVWEIWGALLYGGRLVIVPQIVSQSPESFYKLITNEKVTVLNQTPSAFRQLMYAEEQVGNAPFKTHLRYIVFGGEALELNSLLPWFERHGDEQPRLINMYGITEITVHATYRPITLADVKANRGSVIGEAIPDLPVYILDRHLQPAPIGVPGEICVGGAGLARGYLNRPELTASRFVANPFTTKTGERLYRSGDLARYLINGDIEYIGRMDNQIKIRGFRVELDEIETLLEQHPGIRQALVTTAKDPRGDNIITAYLVSNDEPIPTSRDLRDYLRQQLPEYMVPSAFVMLDKFPLTPNGKIDRRALPDPLENRMELEREYIAPRTPTEEMVAQIFSELLNVPQVGATDHFFELGGHSLLATQLLSRIRDSFKIELPLKILFENPTVEKLAAGIDSEALNKEGIDVQPIVPVPRDQALPLSFAQQRLWFLDQMEPGSPLYNIPNAIRMSGELNIEALEASLNKIIERHELLRTAIETVEGQPRLKISETIDFKIAIDDLSHLQGEEQKRESEKISKEEFRTPFRLDQSPLMRARLLKLKEDDHILLLTMHHIISDGWSSGVLIREIVPLYSGYVQGKPVSLPPLKIQYADFAHWQRNWLSGKVLEEQIDFWRKTLEGAPPYLELPIDHPRPPVQSANGARLRFEVDAEIAGGLRALTKDENATLFMTLLAAYQTLLYRYSGQDDILVGTPIAGRNRKEIEPLIGFFVNTLVMRTDLSDNPSFRELVQRVRQVALEAFAHQDLPFEKLLDSLNIKRDVSRPPLFQTMFALQNIPRSKVELPGLTLSQIEPDNPTAKFEITLEMAEMHDGSLGGVIEYNSDLFEESSILRLIEHFKSLLNKFARTPDTPISTVRFTEHQEEQLVLEQWNSTQAQYPQEMTVGQLFEKQAALTPQTEAVIYGETRFTFEELNRRANQLAHYLRTLGIKGDMPVGLCLERSAESIVALLGILKSGGAYVPFDPEYPEDRLSDMIQDSGISIMISQQSLEKKLSKDVENLLLIDTQWPEIAAQPETNPPSNIVSTNLAYIIYTSGSTGKPKGVMVQHRSIGNLITALQNRIYNKYKDDHLRVSLNAPLSFDASVKQWVTLLMGHTLHIIPQEIRLDGESLLQFITANRIHVLDCVPTQLKFLIQAGFLEKEEWKPYAVIPGGEAIDTKTWQQLREEPQIDFFNMYGPTEATDITTVCEIKKDSARPSIGKPVANVKTYILDSYLQPVPIGVAGELFIGGANVTRGYLFRPQLTAERFIPDPFTGEKGSRLYRTGDLVRWLPDGNIEFIGRVDNQVKIRGFRIELGEIENVLSRHEAVADCVVVKREDTPGVARLIAYFISKEGTNPGHSLLRNYLKEHLPEYMIPAYFVKLDAFPLTPNGKINIRALPEPDDLRPELATEYLAPSSENEKILAEIWQNLLGIKQVGINDNFFELGGDSILSIQMIARARQHGLQITPVQIFKHQTIKELAVVAASAPVIQAEQGEVTGPVPLTPIQKRFFEKQFPNPHHWNQSLMLEVKEKLDEEILRRVVTLLMEHHDAFRLRYREENGVWKQENAPTDDALPFDVIDLTKVSEEEQSQAVSEKSAEFQRSLNLQKGPLARFVYFKMGAERFDRILMIVHHLAMDGISWRILLEDLQAAYQQLAMGRDAQLPPKTTSYKQWAEKLTEYASGDKLAAEKDFWLSMTHRPHTPLPVDIPNGKNDETNLSGVVESLSEEETKALLQEVPPVYNTQINDILLTALVRSFSRWNGKRSLLINLEGHGREDLFDDVDISRTIGWFTAVYPVLLDLGSAIDEGESIKTVKEQIRQIPNKGIGFGLLRYSSDDETLRCSLQKLEQGQVTFNYLGQFDQALPDNSPFAPAMEDKGPDHDPACQLDSLISVSGSIAGNRLHMRFSFSRNIYHEETIRQIAALYIEELRRLIEHCKSPEAGGRTASDFELAKLDNKKLDKVMAQLGKKKKRRGV
ncbi:MAG TPA: amino acid adenylation domain-containing protein [Caldithrix abyssi]|uniref:Amino acid adenylation domain-containing protein n=1 Tax=Caldithrix abyssi TaxID=187145 RepID=A0A7V4U0V9_CALAY|nr:amino acid adenylation domain-containing protein [Caldithrix abyssi]